MATVVNDLFALVMKDLDDENAIRTTTPALFLRHVTRAQQWVALRYQLLIDDITNAQDAGVSDFDTGSALDYDGHLSGRRSCGQQYACCGVFKGLALYCCRNTWNMEK